MPGHNVRILDENQQEVASGQVGDIVIMLPLPTGCLPTLWPIDEGYKQSYPSAFPGCYITTDAG
jgi:propionyl-CoA synthetase